MPTSHSTDLFIPLTSPDALDTALARSHEQPVLLFKHSWTCGTSAMAHEDVSSWLAARRRERPAAMPFSAYLIDVRRDRPVAASVAERFGIRHESPQAFLVRGGRVEWHASHWGVSGDALERALSMMK